MQERMYIQESLGQTSVKKVAFFFEIRYFGCGFSIIFELLWFSGLKGALDEYLDLRASVGDGRGSHGQ